MKVKLISFLIIFHFKIISYSNFHSTQNSFKFIPFITITEKEKSSGMSTDETLSLIQTALQPEIEKRLESRRNLDRIAMEALLKFSQPPSITNTRDRESDEDREETQCDENNKEDTDSKPKL